MNNTTKANPAPIGLLGFGMTTILLNVHNAGFFPLDVVIMAMGITIGGIAQIIAGILEYKNNKTFGTVAFTAYGFFWISLVLIWIMPKLGLGEPHSPLSFGLYLLLWGIFTFGMFIATLKSLTISKLVFGSLFILFILLALANFTGSHLIHTIAGYDGILCGAFAVYEAIAQVINEAYGRKVCPV
ncbi:MAG: acetate uptake transporter [Candidatus Cloacimonadales bacterium]